MYPASFDYRAPKSVEEAVALLREHGDDAKLLAGGHSLLPFMKLRLAQPKILIDLGRVPGLGDILPLDDGSVLLGALVLHADVAASDLVKQRVPGLADAAAVIADTQVRNRGTMGGSIAHADPNADYPVMLTALSATLTIVGPQGERMIAAEDFFVGMFATALAAGEIVTRIRVPGAKASAYAKFPHPATTMLVVSCAAVLSGTSARVAVGGLAGKPVRASAVEQALVGKTFDHRTLTEASLHAADGTSPQDDPYAHAAYKRHLATVYARKALETAAARL